MNVHHRSSLLKYPLINFSACCVIHQVYVIVEGVEKNVGFDPSDPIVQLAVVLGGSVTIG